MWEAFYIGSYMNKLEVAIQLIHVWIKEQTFWKIVDYHYHLQPKSKKVKQFCLHSFPAEKTRRRGRPLTWDTLGTLWENPKVAKLGVVTVRYQSSRFDCVLMSYDEG